MAISLEQTLRSKGTGNNWIACTWLAVSPETRWMDHIYFTLGVALFYFTVDNSGVTFPGLQVVGAHSES